MVELTADVICCTKCTQVKKVDLFFKNKATKTGYSKWCKECSAENYSKKKSIYSKQKKEKYLEKTQEYVERAYAWRKANPEKRQLSERKRHLKQYNLTLDDYLSLLESQKYQCKICNTHLAELTTKENKHQRACVDHCHTTGKVRGLLCYACNLMLGYAKDNPVILGNAIKYLDD